MMVLDQEHGLWVSSLSVINSNRVISVNDSSNERVHARLVQSSEQKKYLQLSKDWECPEAEVWF